MSQINQLRKDLLAAIFQKTAEGKLHWSIDDDGTIQTIADPYIIEVSRTDQAWSEYITVRMYDKFTGDEMTLRESFQVSNSEAYYDALNKLVIDTENAGAIKSVSEIIGVLKSL